MTGESIMLTILCSLLTATSNLLMRKGLVDAGGLAFTGGGRMAQLFHILQQAPFDIGVIVYGIAALVWFRVLSIAQVSLSYPFLIATTFVLVSVGAMLFFKEPFSLQKILSIFIILVGIIGVASA